MEQPVSHAVGARLGGVTHLMGVGWGVRQEGASCCTCANG
jgi:hypothetical protein